MIHLTKTIWLSTGLIVAFLVVTFLLMTISATAQTQFAPPSPAAEAADRPSSSGFAVVELFTSEGCSSCPPADRVLTEIQAIAERDQLPVYVLGYHVDYWNRLGWDDRFSDPRYSALQRKYGQIFQAESVYTPQMIVNGQAEFNGGHSKKAIEEIQAGLKSTTSGTPTITTNVELLTSTPQVKVTAHSSLADDHIVARVVVVQKTGQSQVSRGENSGRNLTHVRIVRDMAVARIDSQGNFSATLALPAEVAKTDLSLVLIGQNPQTGQIHFAHETPLSN